MASECADWDNGGSGGKRPAVTGGGEGQSLFTFRSDPRFYSEVEKHKTGFTEC